jgi:hypothetical protein
LQSAIAHVVCCKRAMEYRERAGLYTHMWVSARCVVSNDALHARAQHSLALPQLPTKAPTRYALPISLAVALTSSPLQLVRVHMIGWGHCFFVQIVGHRVMLQPTTSSLQHADLALVLMTMSSLFTNCLRWGRCYECMGGVSRLVSAMSIMTKGIQSAGAFTALPLALCRLLTSWSGRTATGQCACNSG